MPKSSTMISSIVVGATLAILVVVPEQPNAPTQEPEIPPQTQPPKPGSAPEPSSPPSEIPSTEPTRPDGPGEVID